MGHFLLLVFLSLLSIAISTDHVRKVRMTGGLEAGPAQFPYQVALQIGGEFCCGGSIIHERYVMTAAHCLFDHNDRFKSNDVQVIVGVSDVYSKSLSKVVVKVEKIFIPKEYSFSSAWYKGGDIAILKLRQSLNIYNNQYIKKLEPPEAKSYFGEKALVTGYGYNWVKVNKNPRTGQLERGYGGSNGKLRYSEAFIVTNAECGSGYGREAVPHSLVCAKTIQQDSNKPGGICGGDSGGPLVVKGNVVIGIVSVSPTECREHEQAAIYTRVSYWRNFIEDCIAGKSKPNILVSELPL